MSDEPKIIELTDELAQETARKFGVSVETVREHYAALQAEGPEAALAEMNANMAEIDQAIDEVVADTPVWMGPDRLRAMADYYQAGWDAATADELDAADLFLKLSVALYKLAEAKEQIASLMDGQHRHG